MEETLAMQSMPCIETELSTVEQKELEALESTIGNHLKSFLEVGAALLRIKDGRLYRSIYSTFEEYCRQRWEISRGRAYQLMSSSQVQQHLPTDVDTPDTLNEALLRPLTKLPADQQRMAWARAARKANGARMTSRHTAQAVEEILGREGKEDREPAKVSEEFKQGFDLFVEEIRNAKLANWETTSRSEALRHLNLLRKEVL